MVTSLVRADEAFSNDELVEWLRRRLGDAIVDVVDEFETLTVVVTPEVWVASPVVVSSFRGSAAGAPAASPKSSPSKSRVV